MNDVRKTSEKDDGGDAFPVPCSQPFGDGRMATGGMSLRDYFAAKAMQGFSASGAEEWSSAEDLAHDAYTLADAMLRERAK